EELDPRLPVDPVGLALEQMVVPAQLGPGEIEAVAAGQQAVAALGIVSGEDPVGPRPDDQALQVPGTGRRAPAPHSGVVLQGAAEEDIVPAADVQGWYRDLLV